MPRPVAMRVSYGTDAAYLLRLKVAVAKDGRRSKSWRRQVLRHLHAAATLFLQADAQGMGIDEPSSEEVGKGKVRRTSQAGDPLAV